MSVATHPVSEQLVRAFAPVFYFARIFGLAPFGVADRGGGMKAVFLSPPFVGYSVLFGFTLAVLACIGVVDDLEEDEVTSIRMRDRSSRIITSGDIFIVIFLVLITISTAIVRRKYIYAILRCIKEVDAIVAISNVDKLKWHAIKFMATTVTIACCLLSFDLFVWNNIASHTKKSFAAANYLPFYFSYIVLVVFQSQYCLAVNCIKTRFVALQEALSLENASLIMGNSFFSRRSSAEFTECKQSQLARKQLGTVIDKLGKTLPVQDVVFVRTADKSKKLISAEYLAQMVYAYENLADMVGHLNEAFGIALLIVTASVILHLIVTPYFFVLEVVGRQHRLFMVLQGLWIGAHLGRLLMIVEPCHRTQNAAEQIKPLICKLLTFDVEGCVRQQLEIFNVQLIHRRVRFSICGLFEIDRSAITTIVGTITTYLVILLQFNKSN